MKSKKTTLDRAKKDKLDEFYTQYSDIESEMNYYKDSFNNKIVYCNCDNPKYSNFWLYFKNNFEYLKLKSLYATYYKNKGNSKFHKLEYVNGELKEIISELKTDKKKEIKK